MKHSVIIFLIFVLLPIPLLSKNKSTKDTLNTVFANEISLGASYATLHRFSNILYNISYSRKFKPFFVRVGFDYGFVSLKNFEQQILGTHADFIRKKKINKTKLVFTYSIGVFGLGNQLDYKVNQLGVRSALEIIYQFNNHISMSSEVSPYVALNTYDNKINNDECPPVCYRELPNKYTVGLLSLFNLKINYNF